MENMFGIFTSEISLSTSEHLHTYQTESLNIKQVKRVKVREQFIVL